MTTIAAFRREDGSQSVALRVVSEPMPRSGDHRCHRGELVVRSDWINTATDLDVRVGGEDDELAEWDAVLRRFAEGEAAEGAGLIAPVPGGVGPVTVAMLLAQTVEAAARQLGGR
jgi:5,10-methylene-tetrahydrofolate dehydrogenase/methenyl tetrahydrofolate cyclohydrolase